jgi:hypothetical protein
VTLVDASVMELGTGDLHMGILKQQTAICTHPTATNTFFILFDCTIQSKPLNVSANEKMFLKTRRQVKDSMDMSPVQSLAASLPA